MTPAESAACDAWVSRQLNGWPPLDADQLTTIRRALGGAEPTRPSVPVADAA